MPAIQLKRSTTAGHVPSSLAAGEFAQNLPDELLYFRNPSAVVTPLKLLEGERLITRGSISSAASLTVSVDPAVIGIYRLFKFLMFDWRPASDGDSLHLRVGDSTGLYSGASDYNWALIYGSGGGGSFKGATNATGDPDIEISYINASNSNCGANGTLWLTSNDPAVTVHTMAFASINAEYNSSGFYPTTTLAAGQLIRSTTIDLTQFQLFFGSGNITAGKYALVGIP